MEFSKDYYDILNIPPNATDKEIQAAFRKLARQYSAEGEADPETNEKLHDVHEAYETLSDTAKRKKYDHWLKQYKSDRSSLLSLHTVPSHKVLPYLPTEQAYYVLLSIMPTAGFPTSRLPLNICLVLDKSNSMKGTRIQQLKEATHRIINKLRPEDALGLVVFSDRAQVLIEAQRHIDPARAKAIISTIQPGGGTEILQGLTAGLQEIKRNQSQMSVNHIILLTDGQTYGDEQGCLEQATWAGMNQIHLSTIGVGSDWNEDLLDQMANRSGGTSIYIDQPEKLQNIFSETMQNLEAVVARELNMTITPQQNVGLHEAFQITPQINRLESHDNVIALGPLSINREKSVLMEFRLKGIPLGEQRLTRITVEADIPGQTKNRSWEWVELTAKILNEQPDLKNVTIPDHILNAMSKLSVYKMQEKVAADLAAGQIEKATQRLERMATHLFNMGEPELSRIALTEAQQLSRTRALSPEGSKQIRYGTRALSAKDIPQLTARFAQLTQQIKMKPNQSTGKLR